MFLSLSSPIEDDDEEVAAFDAFSFIRSVTAINSFASCREKMKIECEKKKEGEIECEKEKKREIWSERERERVRERER